VQAPEGREVGLTYDTSAEVWPGDALVTGTGRVYLVTDARQVRQRSAPAGQRRWRLRALVTRLEHLPDDTVILPLHWYRRARRRP
jgi:hypothetical protein